MFKNLFEYYKTHTELTKYTIIILLVCLAVGISAIFLRKWLKTKQEQKSLEEKPTTSACGELSEQKAESVSITEENSANDENIPND